MIKYFRCLIAFNKFRVDVIRMYPNACIIFDIDGVLIDTRKSYNEAIKKTVQYVVSYFNPDINGVKTLVSDEMIFNFRKSGMFNNDIDTSYAFILSILCGPSKISDLHCFLDNITNDATANGIISVEDYLQKYSKSPLNEIKKRLNYPGNIDSSMLTRIFDEYFYGPNLFKKQHNTVPKYCFERPLIDKDKLLVRYSTMKKLSFLFNKRIGIVSGRSKTAAMHSMKSIFKFFDATGSVFLEDERRDMGKPNPSALVKCVKSFGVKNAFYVGDSAEDLIMVQRARKVSKIQIKLVGICDPNSRLNKIKDLFNNSGTSLSIKNVNELPNILNKVTTHF
jgi:phosphoglycolate phosphatase-like HAD superfamily hydrolase